MLHVGVLKCFPSFMDSHGVYVGFDYNQKHKAGLHLALLSFPISADSALVLVNNSRALVPHVIMHTGQNLDQQHLREILML